MSQNTNRDLGQHISFAVRRTFTGPQPIPPEELFFKTFSLDGDGVTFGMDVDGSVTPQDFQVIVPTGKMLLLHEVSWHIVDAGITMTEFGGIPALTNGCLFHLHDESGGQLVSLTDDRAITTNYEFTHIGGVQPQIGPGQDAVFITLNFQEMLGYVPYLKAGQYIAFHIRDNLTALTHFEAVAVGRLIDV